MPGPPTADGGTPGAPNLRPQLRRVAEVSGGNPLYALAIADELGEDRRRRVGHARASRSPASCHGSDGTSARTRSMPGAVDPLLVAAAVSRPRVALLQSVLPDFVLSDLDSAERTGVIVPRCATVFASLIRCSPRPTTQTLIRRVRRELHRLLAEVLEDEVRERVPPRARRRSARPRDRRADRAGRPGCRAAGAPDTGAELLEQAARLATASLLRRLVGLG